MSNLLDRQMKMVASRTGFRPVRFLLCLAMAGGAGCCSWTDKSGTHHLIVVGIGIVSVNNSKPAAATVTRANVLGLAADQGEVTAGYSSRFSTAVPDGAEDVRIEASQRPFAGINVEVQKTQLSQTNQTQLNKE